MRGRKEGKGGERERERQEMTKKKSWVKERVKRKV